ncbi:Tyrosine recombinase XerC [Sodalis glossinidius str. 'morsitans']|uniref:Phage integrase n=1 Tax=Sodalis glossinidius (strain morsitans) TaxID=343509 RepID=Q2NTM9_SODGM|nr:tyrosine-type recombinase/integrase [Sodalis glossinidius]BAE74496.1 putative phage integrase [Sodalis glossinidius str. 'morsitans']CRL45194.1 Tyrosine recombinase XerC [Sodalis glossinidius str. 'morsitans']
MGQRRKNPEDNKLSKNVYRGKYKTYFKPSQNQTIALGPKDMSISETWRQYEVELSELTKVITFSRLWHSFLGSAYFSELKPRTQKDYLQHQKKLIAVFGEVKADNIKPEHVRTFMDKRGLQSKTQANHEMASMSHVYKWGYERGYVKGNPCAGVMKFKAVKRDRYITDEEYTAIYNAADDVVKAAMEIAYLCAARLSDVLGMKWQQITEQGIFIQQVKTGIKQIKAWTPRLREAIEIAKSSSAPAQADTPVIMGQHKGHYTKRGFSNRWTEARSKASAQLGYELDCTFHDLKAKGISDYKGSTKDKQLFSGHKSESQVLVYDRKVRVTPSLDVPTMRSKK